eukprot:gene20014-biopygen7028
MRRRRRRNGGETDENRENAAPQAPPEDSNIGVRLAETVSRHVGSKEMRAFWHFGREITYKIRVLAVFALFAFLSRVGARDLGIPAFAPRFGPPHTRA